MTMIATVLRTNPRSLLVRDSETGEEVLVNYRNAGRFPPGSRVRITYSGAMTFSIPPQITATSIQRITGPAPSPSPVPPPAPGPSRMSATVVQTGRTSLLVNDTQNRRQVRVDYPFAYHFCAGQRITVMYDVITFSNPPRVNATDITPVC